MKTTHSLLLLLIAIFSLPVQAEIKSAFINPVIILSKAPQAVEATRQIKAEFGVKENGLRDKAIAISKLEESYKKDSAIMSESQRQKLETEILDKKREFQREKQAIQQELNQRQNEEMQKLQLKVTQTIRAYAEKHQYDFIFTEGVSYASKKVDITDEILKELGKEQGTGAAKK